MFIPERLSAYLLACNAGYDVCHHRHARGSLETAHVARVPAHCLAKGVLLEGDEGCVMAVVPGDRYVRLGRLSQMLQRPHLRLADAARIAAVFPDCEAGAVPALGMAWGLETVLDEELETLPVVYMECGDHERLLKLSQPQFQALMRGIWHGRFSDVRLH
jgi:Ala-tRNA(Pro) deacylase